MRLERIGFFGGIGICLYCKEAWFVNFKAESTYFIGFKIFSGRKQLQTHAEFCGS